MDRILETTLGCVFALGIWRASKENWFVAFVGVLFLAWVLKFADHIPFPFNFLVFAGGFGLMSSIIPLWEHIKKYSGERVKKYSGERVKKYSAEIETKRGASDQ